MKTKQVWRWTAAAGLIALMIMVVARSLPRSQSQPIDVPRRVSTEPLGTTKPTLKGRAPEQVEVVPPPGEVASKNQVAEHTLTGVVLDEGGSPVPGACVWVAEPHSGFGAAAGNSTIADDDGRFSLDTTEIAVGRNLHAYHVGFLPSWFPIEENDFERACRLILGRGHRIVGRVTDPDGAALEGVRVEALGVRGEDFALTEAEFGEYVVPAYSSAITAVDGTYELAGLTPGEYRIRSSVSGYAMPGEPGRLTLLPDVAPEPQNIVLHPVLAIRLAVLDSETGEPIRTATVHCGGRGLRAAGGRDYQHPMSMESSDPLLFTGQYAAYVMTLGSRPQSEMRVHVKAPGYEAVKSTVRLTPFPGDLQALRLQRLGDPVDVTLDARFDGGSEGFSGVLNLCMRPLGSSDEYRVPVRLVEGRSPRAITLARGTYTVWLESAGSETTYWTPASVPRTVALQGPSMPLGLRLVGGRLEIRVLDRSGAVLPEFRLSVVRADLGGVLATWQEQIPLPTTADGARVFWFPPGEVRVGVLKMGYHVNAQDVAIPADGSSLPLEVVLDPE